ncbi:MAG: hypothetical protein RIG67_28845 [Rhodospirillales bacterium]
MQHLADGLHVGRRLVRRTISGLIAVSAVMVLAGCSSIGKQLSDIFFVPHPNSAETEGEITELHLIYKTKPAGAVAGALPALGPVLAAAAVKEIEGAIEAESKRYVASYSASVSGEFFENTSKILRGIRFVRKINAKSGEDAVAPTAMSLCMLVDVLPSAQSVFRLRPYSLTFVSSKAKVVVFDLLSPFGFDLLNPWELVTDWFQGGPKLVQDDDVDLTIDVKVTNLILEKQSNLMKTVELGSLSLPLKKTKMATPPTVPDHTAPGIRTRPCDEQNFDDLIKSNGSMAAGTLNFDGFMPRPRKISEGDTAELFTVSVNVTEVDDFGARVKELGEKFKEKKEGFQEQLNNLFAGSASQ